jgi:hypothetical protein
MIKLKKKKHGPNMKKKPLKGYFEKLRGSGMKIKEEKENR